jgi:3-methyladenine DNA glycosylase Tag
MVNITINSPLDCSMDYTRFRTLHDLAAQRKGGKAALRRLLPEVPSRSALAALGDDRALSAMARTINRAGFNWQVIENKWPQFEEAFFGFDIGRLASLPIADWEAYTSDKRVVRNWPKIKAVMENVGYILGIAEQHGSFGRFIAAWPGDDQIGLMAHMKKHGSRLGGATGQWFLRQIGWDGFIMTADVIAAINRAGVAVADQPSSKGDLTKVQQMFNAWHQESGLPYTHIGKIAAYSIGTNYDSDFIHEQMNRFA